MLQPDFAALRRRVENLNEAWAAAMRAVSAEAARLSCHFDETGFDRAVADYAADLASPAGDFVSRLIEAGEADALAEALAEEALLHGTPSDAAHHSTHFTRGGLRAA